MESTFRESLARLLNIKIQRANEGRYFYKMGPSEYTIPDLWEGSLGVVGRSGGHEVWYIDLWSITTDYYISFMCEDAILIEYRGMIRTSIICFKDFFENIPHPCTEEIEILNITHPWVLPAITTMIRVVSLHGGEDVITE